jgi:transcriptional regulator with XRE-family HTH domain
MSEKLKRLWSRLSSKTYRDAFVGAHLSNTIAAQISTMREDRGWTQHELAVAAEMKQSRSPVLEDPNNESLSIKTLRRVAAAFDVALIVRFAAFSEAARWASASSSDKYSVPAFENDAVFEDAFAAPVESRTQHFVPRSLVDFGLGSRTSQPPPGGLGSGVLDAYQHPTENFNARGAQWML